MKKPPRYYGNIEFKPLVKKQDNPDYYQDIKPHFLITGTEPHVSIKLKSVFAQVPESEVDNFRFAYLPDICHDLLWFMDRYPLRISDECFNKLKKGRNKFLALAQEIENILTEGYIPKVLQLNTPYEARKYQLTGSEYILKAFRGIIGDDLGLGKSLTSVLAMYHTGTLPALVVCQSHLPVQWKEDTIELFTNLSVHHIKTGKPYKLPAADVYIISYHILAKWIDILVKMIKYVVFDEVQELRRSGIGTPAPSKKYAAAKTLCEHVKYAVGLSATPVMNYGIEMFNIMNCLKPGSLGKASDFIREWCGYSSKGIVKDPQALGTYLRENYLMIRRTSEEVGLGLPQLNTIVTTVDYEMGEIERDDELTRKLAISLLNSSSFTEKGELARELDQRLRRLTGLAKARPVAGLVKILLDCGKKVLLSGWHRDVYAIWEDEFREHNPVFYTGNEYSSVKQKSKEDFVSGKSNLMIISNRSGAGMDGLQYVCHYLVNGELDWSPEIHRQLAGRLNRPGQTERVTSIFPICNYGSDPSIVNVLALKRQQSSGIVDPLKPVEEQHSDESRMKKLAEDYLKQHPH